MHSHTHTHTHLHPHPHKRKSLRLCVSCQGSLVGRCPHSPHINGFIDSPCMRPQLFGLFTTTLLSSLFSDDGWLGGLCVLVCVGCALMRQGTLFTAMTEATEWYTARAREGGPNEDRLLLWFGSAMGLRLRSPGRTRSSFVDAFLVSGGFRDDTMQRDRSLESSHAAGWPHGTPRRWKTSKLALSLSLSLF
ncbi:hypothetical protein ABB37_06480 [Leptomonas pyrrhocoris]|uniref:Uncharacterized protein n=1 Tax=Leptomonas pyrrhocoris TaxID=157538 RepID=A0A0M9FYA3_LEPPY|nr:hypothetical protein ABB37_06480 [Leptomonas pyrrhocoris]KPA78356.1 hypothetical protein ABB37_06480 [Leptomonas pyrrhocoris]|eukprot:XP_015656795.1 hypothetical protein ABB37_06480 [Leptomonas pyrrhocoris]